MADQVIFERFGVDRVTADQLAEQFRIDGWNAEVIEEPDGTFMIRAFPPDFGSTEPAMNTGAATAPISAGPPPPPPPSSGGVKGLLDFISEFESGGNYNAFFRHGRNQNNPKFTQMLLKNVIAWQKRHTQVNGAQSSAAGRYQIIRKTLTGLIESMNLDPNTLRYTHDTQDRMAIKLMEEKGLNAYLAGTQSAERFANRVAQVWAALPIVSDDFKDASGRTGRKGFSVYAGDGLNKAHVGVESYLRAVKAVRS